MSNWLKKEGKIALALQTYTDGYFTSFQAATSAYDVPKSTLQDASTELFHDRKYGLQTSNVQLRRNQRIISMDQRGLAPRASSVQQMANFLLAKRLDIQSGNQLLVGERWAYNFIKRQPDLQSRYNHKYDYQRAKCEDLAIIRDWFRLVRNTIAKDGILKDDIYDFGKTGFQKGVMELSQL